MFLKIFFEELRINLASSQY